MDVDGPNILVSLPPRPQYLSLVRQVLGSFAQRLGMTRPAIDDLKTVVTEACTDAVVHAYPDTHGSSIRVEASRQGAELAVAVRDRFRILETDDGDSRELGMKLISALCNEFRISTPRIGETEISMRLPLR